MSTPLTTIAIRVGTQLAIGQVQAATSAPQVIPGHGSLSGKDAIDTANDIEAGR